MNIQPIVTASQESELRSQSDGFVSPDGTILVDAEMEQSILDDGYDTYDSRHDEDELHSSVCMARNSSGEDVEVARFFPLLSNRDILIFQGLSSTIVFDSSYFSREVIAEAWATFAIDQMETAPDYGTDIPVLPDSLVTDGIENSFFGDLAQETGPAIMVGETFAMIRSTGAHFDAHPNSVNIIASGEGLPDDMVEFPYLFVEHNESGAAQKMTLINGEHLPFDVKLATEKFILDAIAKTAFHANMSDEEIDMVEGVLAKLPEEVVASLRSTFTGKDLVFVSVLAESGIPTSVIKAIMVKTLQERAGGEFEPRS